MKNDLPSEKAANAMLVSRRAIKLVVKNINSLNCSSYVAAEIVLLFVLPLQCVLPCFIRLSTVHLTLNWMPIRGQKNHTLTSIC